MSSRIPKDGGEGDDDTMEEEEKTEDLSLMAWLNEYHSLVDATADILKGDIATIQRSKIVRHRETITKEKKPEVIRLSKNIVTGFQDVISKAVKDLNLLSTTMAEELQKRYNLPAEWASTNSMVGSIAGSDVFGPTFPRRDIESLISLPPPVNGSDNRASPCPPQPNENDGDLTFPHDDSLFQNDNDISRVESNDMSMAESEFETAESEPSKLDDHNDDDPPESDRDIVDASDDDEQEATPVNENENTVLPTASTSTTNSPIKTPEEPKTHKKLNIIKQEKTTGMENKERTPSKKSREGSREKSKTPSSSSKKRTKQVDEDSDAADSDSSGKTCVLHTKSNRNLSKSLAVNIKLEKVSEKEKLIEKNKSQDEHCTSESSKHVSSTKSTKLEKGKTGGKDQEDSKDDSIKDNEEVDIPAAPVTGSSASTTVPNPSSSMQENVISTNTDDDDFMDFLAPPSPTGKEDNNEMDFDDDTRTVILPTGKNKVEVITTENKPSNSEPNKPQPSHSGESKTVDEDHDNCAGHRGVKQEKESKAKTEADKDKIKERKDERDAMRKILGSSSEESDSATSSKIAKAKQSLSRGRPKKNLAGGESNEEGEQRKTTAVSKEVLLKDPKLKEGAATVKIAQLDAAILKTLADKGYVRLENYKALKKLSCEDLENASEDSDASDNDSTDELRKLVRQLTKNSILQTKHYNKKIRVAEHSGKRRRQKKLTKRSSDKSCELDSTSDSDSDAEFTQKYCKKPPIISGGKDIISASGSEDLDEADTGDEKNTRSKSQSKRSTNGKKQKYYKQATLSSDDSGGGGDMKGVIGSDSETDGDESKRKSKRIKKQKGSDSDSDSDFISKRTKSLKDKRNKVKSGSEGSLITLSSDTSDSDFKSSKKRRRKRGSSPESEKEKSKKKRRRIIQKNSSGTDSDIQEVARDSDDDGDGSPTQKGRKKIRKIMKSRDLAKTTKEAEKDEEERRTRLSEKQQLFNGVHKAPESDKIERLVLDVDPDTKEVLLEVDPSIVAHLKPHQAEGIRFMFNASFESVKMIKEDKAPGGCILAHCMGLGKTLQSVAFLHTMLTNKVCGIRTVLVICPLSTTKNWFDESKKWTEDAEKRLKIHDLSEMKNDIRSRTDHLKAWQRLGGLGILHYDMFRRLADPKGKYKRMKESLRKLVTETLLDPGPDMVICDEGHLLKNWKSLLSLAVNNIRTHRRIVLTGTPLQNNLVEYHTMMNFVKPNLLGSLPEFTNRFVNPIKNGQHADSTDYDVRTMKKRSHVLHRKLEGCVQRYDYSILSPYLPPKYEYIIHIKLTEKQEQLYKYYLANVVAADPDAKRRGLLKYYAELVKVWSHPIALTMRRSKQNDNDETEESEDSIKDFINDNSTDDEVESGEGSNDSAQKTKRKTRAQAANDPEPEGSSNSNGGLDDAFSCVGKWWSSVFKSKNEMYDVTLSGKLVVLQEILKTCEAIGDKVLVFSQFLSSLDIIEEFLKDWDDEVIKLNKEKEKETEKLLTFPFSQTSSSEGRWRKNIEYFRIDGSTKILDRHSHCKNFNKTLTRAKLFLISTKAGGLGINLYGANRVIVFDVSWNPSQDMQSIFRVYRFGQEKPCYIYRLIAKGTMEEKILRRQITKLSLSSRVVDEHQIQRHFKFDDVNEMYKYDEEDPSTSNDSVLAVPKDRLLADLIISHKDLVRNYEEFDSLLENQTDEDLSKEEKEIAWAEYRIESERQKNRINVGVSHNQEAETYVKVKNKLVGNYLGATEEQLEDATGVCIQVIDKIRRAMLNQNQLQTPEQQAVMGPYISPLKEWLAQSVSGGPVDAPPPGTSLLRPLPPQFHQPIPYIAPAHIQNPYSYHQNGFRPPIIRRQYGNQVNPMMANYNQPRVQNIQRDFSNIVANHLPNVRPPFAANPQLEAALRGRFLNGAN